MVEASTSARPSRPFSPTRFQQNHRPSRISPIHSPQVQSPIARDPIAALHKILSEGYDQPLPELETPVVRPDRLETDIDFAGLTLSQFAASSTLYLPRGHCNSSALERYEAEKSKIEELQKSIHDCDLVLGSVESHISGFRTDLAAVVAKIETLQTRSSSFATRLENRKAIEDLLGPTLQNVIVPSTLIHTIVDGPIDLSWPAALEELARRKARIELQAQESGSIAAIEDVGPLLASLTNKAVERIREHFVNQIKAIRAPNVNAQQIQNHEFIPLQPLFAFITRLQPRLSRDIIQAYINTMRWYYSSLFSRYEKVLDGIHLNLADRRDTLGAVSSTGGVYDFFTIGRRLDILKSPFSDPLVSHLQDDKATHFPEFPFRSFTVALVDNACFEYSFISSFFGPCHSHQTVAHIFSEVFAPTLSIGLTYTRRLLIDGSVGTAGGSAAAAGTSSSSVSSSSANRAADAIAILVCIRLMQKCAFELQRRRVPVLEAYVNETNMQLWPRFQGLMDSHCESVRRAPMPQLPSTTTPRELSASYIAPLPLTQRFATFAHALLALCAKSPTTDSEPIAASLRRLCLEVQTFLARAASAGGAANADGNWIRQRKAKFLDFNYSLISTVLNQESTANSGKNKLVDEVRQIFAKPPVEENST